MIEILYIVFFVIGALLTFWEGRPPWSMHAYYMTMWALTGLALFDGGHALLLR